jgi:hypothetical protein
MSIHTDRLQLAAQLIKLADEAPKHGLLTDSLITAGGLKGMEASSPLVRGKWRQWHGSSPENMRKMKQEGIRTMDQAKRRGHSLTGALLEAQGPDIWEQSKNMAFTGRKSTAKEFIAQALSGSREDGLEWVKRMLKNGLKAKFIRPLSVEIPIHQTAGRVKVNPEWVNFDKKVDNPIARFMLRGLKHSRGIEGGVRASEIAGGKGFRYVSSAGIKAKPLRALAGLLGLAGSAGVAGYGLKDMGRHAERAFGPKQ